MKRKKRRRGGARPGAGRPRLDPDGELREPVTFSLTKTEKRFLMEALDYRRSQMNAS
jgi:hypothetical protein